MAEEAAAAPAESVVAPASQLAPVLVSFAAAGATQQVTVQLRPQSLGLVQISIDRAADGSATVQVTADRAETLALLQRDQSQLQGALDQAGLPRDGRSIVFGPSPAAQTLGAASLPAAPAAQSSVVQSSVVQSSVVQSSVTQSLAAQSAGGPLPAGSGPSPAPSAPAAPSHADAASAALQTANTQGGNTQGGNTQGGAPDPHARAAPPADTPAPLPASTGGGQGPGGGPGQGQSFARQDPAAFAAGPPDATDEIVIPPSPPAQAGRVDITA